MTPVRLLTLLTIPLLAAACGSDGGTTTAPPVASSADESTVATSLPVTAGLTIRMVSDGGCVPSMSSPGDGWMPVHGTDEHCQIGPIAADGSIFRADAAPQMYADDTWGVVVFFRDGADGIDVFNGLAASCFQKTSTCPTGRLAFIVGDEIVAAPTVMTPEFAGSIEIRGNLTEADARAIADVVNTGAAAG